MKKTLMRTLKDAVDVLARTLHSLPGPHPDWAETRVTASLVAHDRIRAYDVERQSRMDAYARKWATEPWERKLLKIVNGGLS